MGVRGGGDSVLCVWGAYVGCGGECFMSGVRVLEGTGCSIVWGGGDSVS